MSKHDCHHVKTVRETVFSHEHDRSLLVKWKCILTDTKPWHRQESRVVAGIKSKNTIPFAPPSGYASCLKSSDRFYYEEGKCHLYPTGIDLVCSKCGNLNNNQSTNVIIGQERGFIVTPVDIIECICTQVR